MEGRIRTGDIDNIVEAASAAPSFSELSVLPPQVLLDDHGGGEATRGRGHCLKSRPPSLVA